ncbi:MAG: DUF2058 family protein [Bradymonadales bacterium]|jgi:uncharacterized protein YaiL (DUF2058 family)
MGSFLEELKKAGLADAKKQKQIEREKRKQAHIERKQAAKAAPPVIVETATLDLEKQTQLRIGQLLSEGMVQDYSGRKRFYFQTPDDSIHYLQISDICAALLERGKYAIVQILQDDFAVIRRAQALAIEELKPELVVLLQRKET